MQMYQKEAEIARNALIDAERKIDHLTDRVLELEDLVKQYQRTCARQAFEFDRRERL